MTSRMQTLFVALVGIALALSVFVTLRQDTAYRVDFDSVREIWSDLVHDADRVGLGLTRVSTREEMAIGDAIHRRMPVATDDARLAYVEEVGQAIARHAHRKDIAYRFHILSAPEINAFAIPGGHVYITRPLLDLIETEAELASILGHEIAHVDLRHCIERMQYDIHLRRVVGPLADVFGMAYWLFGVSYNHQQESEADRSGVLLTALAGYDPVAAVRLDQRLAGRMADGQDPASKPQEPVSEAARAVGKLASDYVKTHPSLSERIQALQALIAQNESAWEGREFCVGRANFAALTPCFVKTFPGEVVTIAQAKASMRN